MSTVLFRLGVFIAGFALFLTPAASHARQECSDDLNGDGVVDGADLAQLLSSWGATYPASIDAVTPASGPLEGGTSVTIVGTHLAATTLVEFGGVAASDLTVVSSTEVHAITPPGSSGAVDIAVTTPAGTTTLAGGFTYDGDELDWATVLEFEPDPKVVTDPKLYAGILATGLPWRVRDNASQIEMLLVPPGTFMMGCSPSDQSGCYSDETPIHEVTLTQAFYLGRYEVTQAQWTAVMGSNPSYHQGSFYPNSETRPVERVSWNMIQGFEASTGLRLPTEAEWEYACRAGTTTAYNLPPHGTDDENQLDLIAWYFSNSGFETHEIGGKIANNLGLHDMHGNVYEWCEDWYGDSYYAVSPSVDPAGPSGGNYRVLRGFSWISGADQCRASQREGVFPPNDTAAGYLGFRAARTP